MKSMNRKIGIGVLWNLSSLIFTRGASTLFMLFLARLLAPEAFGMIAMAAVVFEMANTFVNSGLGSALVRSKEVSAADLNTVFYSNLGLSLVAYGAIFLGAPYVAKFYSQPELTALIQVMGLVVFFNATRVVQSAMYTRRMDFKTPMKANLLATVIAGALAVTAAYRGWGVWSLVVQMLCQAAIASAVLWLAGSWRPALQFSAASFSRLFTYGRNLLAEGMMDVAFQNAYILVIGRYFSAELTGLYFFARKLSNLISHQLTGSVQQVTFPALATLQDDNVVLKYKYRQLLQLIMFLIAPIMMLLAALSSPLIHLAFGERWAGAVPYLQLMCAGGMLYPLHALNVNLLNVKGRSDLTFKIGMVKRAVSLTLLFLAIPYGVLGIVVSQVIATTLALVPNTYYSTKLVGYSLKEQMKDSVKPIVAAALAGLLAWWTAHTLTVLPLLTIVMAAAVGSGAYLLLSFGIRTEGALILWGQACRRLQRAQA